MNFWTLTLLRLFPTPERIKDLIEEARDAIGPERLRVYHDDTLMPNADIDPMVGEIARKRALVARIDWEGHDSEGQPFTPNVRVQTRFKNDGSDSIEIDGVPMLKEDFEFHCKPLKKEFAIELGYTDPRSTDPVLTKHLILITNAEPKPKQTDWEP